MKELLKNSGFQSFLWTQFLGAFNDNVYKILVSVWAVHMAAATGTGGEYLSLAGAVFVLPFLLFSGYSGHLADAVSKRTVLISVKVFEVGVMALARIICCSFAMVGRIVRSSAVNERERGLATGIAPIPRVSSAREFSEQKISCLRNSAGGRVYAAAAAVGREQAGFTETSL